MPNKKISILKFIAVIIPLILVDILTKTIFKDVHYLIIDSTINKGSIFGILQGYNTFFIVISIIFIFILLYLYKREHKIRLGLEFIIAGAIANLISRFMYAGVLDFISIWQFPTFNLADAFIVVGVLISLYKIFGDQTKKRYNKKR